MFVIHVWVHSSPGLFGSQLFLGYHDFHGQKLNTITHHSQGWLWQLSYLKMASWTSLWYIFISEKQARKTMSQREADGQWVITVGLMTYVGWTCLFTHIFAKKKKLSLVSGSYIIYDVYIIYTVHTATYTQHQGIKCMPSSYRVFSYHDKSHSWTFLGTQV